MLLLTYKALHGLAPSYLKDLIILYIPSRPSGLLGAGLLSLPKVKEESAGNKVLAYLWNSLPPVIREADSADIFRAKLKTSLFPLVPRGAKPAAVADARTDAESVDECQQLCLTM